MKDGMATRNTKRLITELLLLGNSFIRPLIKPANMMASSGNTTVIASLGNKEPSANE